MNRPLITVKKVTCTLPGPVFSFVDWIVSEEGEAPRYTHLVLEIDHTTGKINTCYIDGVLAKESDLEKYEMAWEFEINGNIVDTKILHYGKYRTASTPCEFPGKIESLTIET